MGFIRKTVRGAGVLAVGAPVAHKRSKKDKIVRNTERTAQAIEQMAAEGPTARPVDPGFVDQEAWAAYQQQSTPQAPPAGWYNDPRGESAQRWWDGTAWTEHAQ